MLSRVIYSMIVDYSILFNCHIAFYGPGCSLRGESLTDCVSTDADFFPMKFNSNLTPCMFRDIYLHRFDIHMVKVEFFFQNQLTSPGAKLLFGFW